MLKQFSLILLLVAAIGCTQSGDPGAVPDVTVGASTSTETTLQLPDPTATVVQFFCPGMT